MRATLDASDSRRATPSSAEWFEGGRRSSEGVFEYDKLVGVGGWDVLDGRTATLRVRWGRSDGAREGREVVEWLRTTVGALVVGTDIVDGALFEGFGAVKGVGRDEGSRSQDSARAQF